MGAIPGLNIVVALPAEARPLADAFGLTAAGDHPLRRWHEGDTRLIVSGMGGAASAAAVGWLAATYGSGPRDVWLNVGIAGHRSRERGDVVIAGAIRAAGSRRHHYPAPLTGGLLDAVVVETHDAPVQDYPADACVDMEAAAFAAAAARFGSLDLVQSIKVISDNADAPLTAIDRALVKRLMDGAVGRIRIAASSLLDAAATLPRDDSEAALQPFFDAARFSASERHAARALYRRWRALMPEATWPPPDMAPGAGPGKFAATLEALLPGLPW